MENNTNTKQTQEMCYKNAYRQLFNIVPMGRQGSSQLQVVITHTKLLSKMFWMCHSQETTTTNTTINLKHPDICPEDIFTGLK